MDQKVVVNDYANSQYATAPYKATEGSAGHYLFAAEARTLFRKSCLALITTLKMAIPKGFFFFLFPRSRFLRRHFVTCDAGVIDEDYQGEVVILMNNHSDVYHTIKVGDGIAQIVLIKNMMSSLNKLMIQIS